MMLERVTEPMLALPRYVKRGIAVTLDAGLCVLTVWLAYSLRIGAWVSLSGDGWPAALVSVAIAMPIFFVFGLYRAVFRYVSWEAATSIVQACFVYGIIYASVFTAIAIPGVPRTVGIIQPFLLVIALVAARASVRYVLGARFRRLLRGTVRKNVLIYGAGSSGRQLALALNDTPDTRVAAFVDDDPNLRSSVIGGIPVFGPNAIARAVEDLEIDEVFLAIPSARQTRRNEILEIVRSLGVAVRTLPSIVDIAHGKVSVSLLRPLEIADLLARDPVAPERALLEKNIRDKTVAVTGAGGSIGGELCRQIVEMRPKRLLLIEVSEFALYAIHSELETAAKDVELVPLLASVCDQERMRQIFSGWRPESVYHTAAYKHVPLVEQNPLEGIRNNVLGTLTSAMIAQEFGTKNFVLVSTDKAVRPTNVMGASKRLAEMILQALAATSSTTCFCMVRFGNVLGSSGSVVPLFRQQIAVGGPITVTHREVTRYFMTIPEAAQLVIQAGAMAKGGEVFVLDMGEPVRVIDLAIRMIELSGLKVRNDRDPFGDIEIVFTGLRPGEKLYEELLIGNNPAATSHPRVIMASENFLPYSQLLDRLTTLRRALDTQNAHAAREILLDLVPEYTPAENNVDWIYLADQHRLQPHAGAPKQLRHSANS